MGDSDSAKKKPLRSCSRDVRGFIRYLGATKKPQQIFSSPCSFWKSYVTSLQIDLLQKECGHIKSLTLTTLLKDGIQESRISTTVAVLTFFRYYEYKNKRIWLTARPSINLNWREKTLILKYTKKMETYLAGKNEGIRLSCQMMTCAFLKSYQVHEALQKCSVMCCWSMNR